MNLLLLSGESVSNKPWIESVAQTLGSLGPTKILYYDHWENGQESIDFEKEYAKLPALVEGLDEYVIFAKSIGTALVAKGISEEILNPSKCIFVGPVWPVFEGRPELASWIEGFSTPTLFITKTADPVAPATKLRALLEKYHVKNYQFVELPGDNHKYEDLEKVKSLVEEFLKV